jgi:hypothetical protein
MILLELIDRFILGGLTLKLFPIPKRIQTKLKNQKNPMEALTAQIWLSRKPN